jgi:cytochrome c oxidase accessory protein FixG
MRGRRRAICLRPNPFQEGNVAIVDQPARREPESAPFAHERVYDVAPADELLFSLSADGKRRFMHPVVRKGHFWRIRRNIAYALIVLYLMLPLIYVGGHPSVLLDIATRRFYVFGATFHPTDNLLLAAFGFGVVVTVFFVGSTFGRMWCGFACPQTVYLEFLFRPIEALIEGGPTNQRRLNKAPWTAHKFAIKAMKWLLWTAIAVLMAATFVAYFVSWPALIEGVSTSPRAWSGALFTITALTTLIVFDFGWFRDQMCTIACPYGRLQNVIADPDTIVVAYDTGRGEPRTPPKLRVPGVNVGDCVDCGACVAACPTGTDIRRGLQVECIGTAQCIDACDEVMRKLGRPTGLIRFTSEREQQGGVRHVWRPRNLAYLALMAVGWGTLGALVFTRADALVEIVRGGREAYRLLPTGEVANQQRVRFTNQRDDDQSFAIEIVSPRGASLVMSESPVRVDAEHVVTVNAVTTVPREVFVDGQATVRYRVTSDRGFDKELDFLLLGPFSATGATP